MLVLELIVCVLSLVGFVFLFFGSLSMPYPQSFWDGPGAFPLVLSVVLVLVCVLWLVDVLKSMRASGGKRTEVAEGVAAGGDAANEREKQRKEMKSFVSIGVLTILYIMVLMPLLPFPLATFVFLSVSFLLFSKSVWWKSLILSGIVSVAVYLVFTFILHLPMPR